ncbi:MAG: class flavin-dependent oxidoreductase [Solirubrobacterales bacterium]|jgi:5,10-methylenetetrahydromethanopterin reductase|nr:class flavin-dependent oxidoreductase [Solirubrobacterales bacterium]
MTELGLSLGLSPRESMDRFVQLLQRAEQLGVDAAWIVDSQLAMKDAYVTLAVLARETQTLKMGPGVTNLITRHETVIANAMATLENLSPGRIMVGVGAGDSAVFPIGRKPLTIRECDEGVRRLKALLAGEALPMGDGEKALSFVPANRPPVFFAGSQPRMLRLAGAVADGVIIMGPADVESVRMQLAQVDAGAIEAGRSPSDVQRDLWVTLSVGDGPKPVNDVKSWCSAQARWMTTWRDMPSSLEPYRSEMDRAAKEYDFSTHLSLSAGHADTVSDEFAKVLAVAGTTQECQSRLAALAATGVDRITVSLLSGGRERRLEEIAEVWQPLRALVGGVCGDESRGAGAPGRHR